MKHLSVPAAQAQPGDWLFSFDRYFQVARVERLPRSKTLALTLCAGSSTVVRYYDPAEILALRRPTSAQDLGFNSTALDKNETLCYGHGGGRKTDETIRVSGGRPRGAAGRNGRTGGSASG